MKKFLALTLAMIMMAFALAACGEKDPTPSGDNGTSTPGTSAPDNTSDPGTQSNGDQFEKYGLLGIIPDGATDVVCVRDIAGYMEYTFTMSITDEKAQQLAYQNACLDIIRTASDNGKVYNYVMSYEELANYDELPAGGFGLIVFYYYNDAFHKITVTENGTGTSRSYTVFLSPENGDSLPEK